MTRATVIVVIVSLLAATLSLPVPVYPDSLTLDEPLQFPKRAPAIRQSIREQELFQLGGFTVDIQSREEVRMFFHTVYQASENIPLAWTGSIEQCLPGTTSQAYIDATLLRVNFFRAMAGVPANISFSAELNQKAQHAALMMSANNRLNHFPPSSWRCFTADGAEAAANANLALGSAGPQAVFGFMEDEGANNAAVGHRRWLVYPQTQQMGTGSVGDNTVRHANALWIFDANLFGPRPATRAEFVSWPPPGFVPYQLVFPRWSFSFPRADLVNASVTMQTQGQDITLRVETLASNIGENTLVWVPTISLEPPPVADVTYQVRVSNVVIDGVARTFDYTVMVINPAIPGPDTVLSRITGPAEAFVNREHRYTFEPVAFATGYQWMQTRASAFVDGINAESGLDPLVPSTAPEYNVITTDVQASGQAAFHLAHSQPADQLLTLDRVLLPRNSARLMFASRLGIATANQTAKVQVSTDEGSTWQDVFSQQGTGIPGETSFSTKMVDLSHLVGRIVRIRFIYALTSGRFFPQSEAGVGWYIDDIAFIDVEELSNPMVQDLPADTDFFTLQPTQTGAYALHVRAQAFGDYPLEWGLGKSITVLMDTGNCPHDGDVNGNGSITPADALLAFQAFLGTANPQLTMCQQERANVSESANTAITPADALCIFRAFLRLPSCLS